MNQATPGTKENNIFSKPVPGSRYVFFVLLLLVGTLTDLVSKQLIFAKYYSHDPQQRVYEPDWLVDGWLGIQTSVNQGALFGMGQGYSSLFAALSIAALLVLCYLLFVSRWANDLLITITFGMIAGGIIGNLYDRLGLWHAKDVPSEARNGVRDWIHFRWEDGPKFMDPWPNFNIADSLLVCGAILLCVHSIFFHPDGKKAKKSEDEGDKKVAEKEPEPKNQ